MLEPYEAATVEQAVLGVIRTYRYRGFPPFAVLQEQLNTLTGDVDQEKALDIAAHAEFARIRELIRSHGYYNPPQISNSTTAYVIEAMGGWETICSTWYLESIHWREEEFCDLWLAAHGREEAMALGADGVIALAQRRGGGGPKKVGSADIAGVMNVLSTSAVAGS